jgi:hypothetical protein
MKINLGEVLSKAWRIVWKFKVLWIFGILAGCGGGNGSRFNFNGNSGRNSGSNQFQNLFPQFQNMQPERVFAEVWSRFAGLIAAGILLLCVLWILFYFLGVMGKTGLIKGASKADAGAGTLGFGELWSESTPYFWRMFGLNLLIGLPFFILIMVLIAGVGLAGYSTFKSGNPGAGMGALFVGMLGIFFGLICIISIISIIIGMIVEQAQNAIVLEDLGVLQGLSRGWNVFKSAALTIIVVALVLGVIGWVVGLVVSLPIIAIVVPAAIGMAVAGKDNLLIPLLIASGCFVLYLPVLLVFSGVIQSYTQSVWTLVYRRLTAALLPAQMEVIEQK